MGRTGRLVAGALALAAVGAGTAGVGTAAARTRSPVAGLSVVQRDVTAGAVLHASVTLRPGVRSVGIAFHLSERAGRSARSLALGVRQLRARGSRAVAVRLRAPRVGPLAGRLIACPGKRGGRCVMAAGEVAVLARPRPARARPLGAAGAQTETIGSNGGSVSAVTPSGVLVTLRLPAGALSASTPVTLSPLRSLGATIPGRLRAAAMIAPAGLTLARAATVSFSTPGTAGLGFGAAGENLHLVPVRQGSIAIDRFAGVGEVSATVGRMRAFALAHVAADPLSQLEQLVAAYGAARGRAARAASAAGSGVPDIGAYVVGAANVIEAEAPLAFASALASYQTWQTVVDGLSGEYPGLVALALQVRAALVVGGIESADRDGYRCQQQDLGQITELQLIVRAGGSLPSAQLQAEGRRQISDCLQFDITVDSQLHHAPDWDGQTLDFHYQAKAPLDYQDLSSTESDVQAQGSGNGQFASATVADTDTHQCPLGNSQATTTITMPGTDRGTIAVTLTIPIPVAPGVPVQTATLTLYSTETETYLFHTTGDPACAGDRSVAVDNWWTQLFDGEIETGDATVGSDGDSFVTDLQKPSDQLAAQVPGLVVYKQMPADPALLDSGTTTVQVMQDPGHARLHELAPTG